MKGYLAVLGAVLLALGLLWWMPSMVHHDPATIQEYVQACQDIAKRDHLILPVEESEYLRQEFESGQSPELAMSEWAEQ